MRKLSYRRLARNPLLGAAAVCAVALGFVSAAQAAPDPAATVAADLQVQRVAAANTDFGLRLFARLLADDRDDNIFFSPFSTTQVLTVLRGGADGDTQRDIAATLGLADMARDQVNRANGLLLPSLKNPDAQVELSVANALWARKGFSLNAGFQARCRKYYGARVATMNFDSPAAADSINAWVRRNTRGKIGQIVTPDDLAQATVLVTNAIYFHGRWQEPFIKSATQAGPFALADGSTKTVPLMTQVTTYPYLETDQFQAVALPYGSGRVSMYVFLPKSDTDLDTFLGTLDARTWQDWARRMKPTLLTLFLPRFQARYRAELKGPLSALGMGSAFGLGADFTPMGLRGSFLTQVIHQTVLEVTEEGTVAAAATGASFGGGGLPRSPDVMVRVDHPFFCAIQDNATGTLLFLGAIRNPQ